jgi:hypothetical protein
MPPAPRDARISYGRMQIRVMVGKSALRQVIWIIQNNWRAERVVRCIMRRLGSKEVHS